MAIVTITVEDYEVDGAMRARVLFSSDPEYPGWEKDCTAAQLIGLVVMEDLDLLSKMVKEAHAELSEVHGKD
jgi:hypothetical protein